jgi:sugar phosphate isomerase/epimerase
MDVTLACATVPFEAVSLERALSGISSAGFHHVVVGPAHEGRPVLDLAAGAEGGSALRAELDASGLRAVAVAPELDPVDDANLEALGVVLEQAKSIGAGEVWITGPEAFDENGEKLRDDAEWNAAFNEFVSRLKSLAARAHDLGVGLTVPTQALLSSCGADIEKLFAELDDEAGIHVGYNPGLVSYFSGINPVRDLESVAARVKTLCVRDHRGAIGEPTFPLVGGGDVDYFGVFGVLKQRGFAGTVVAEHLPGTSPEELDASARAANRFLSMMAAQV